MTDGIELLEKKVECPKCKSQDLEIVSVNVDGMEDDEQCKFVTTIYECTVDGHRFNIGVMFEGNLVRAALDECL